MDKNVVPTGDPESAESGSASRKGRTIRFAVTVISSKGPTSLVAWVDVDKHLQRAFLPTDEIVNGKATQLELARAQSFGEPWEKWLADYGDPEKAHALADALRRHGIWSYEQLRKRPNSYALALEDVYGVRAALQKGLRK